MYRSAISAIDRVSLVWPLVVSLSFIAFCIPSLFAQLDDPEASLLDAPPALGDLEAPLPDAPPVFDDLESFLSDEPLAFDDLDSPIPEFTAELILPTGFGNINLGEDIASVKELLITAPYFLYRGEPEIGVFPNRPQQFIAIEGRQFVERAFLQFSEERLYIITLIVSRSELDYFSIYQRLKRYGDPTELNPNRVIWQNDETMIVLEYPATVKYIDRAVFDSLTQADIAAEQNTQDARAQFLSFF